MAVLVAISIPIFTTQLERSRESTDLANIRAAYAEVMADALTDPDNNHSETITKKQTQDGWESENIEVAGVTLVEADGGSGDIVVAYTASTGTVTIAGHEVPERVGTTG